MGTSKSVHEVKMSRISATPQVDCDQSCIEVIREPSTIVTGLDKSLQYQTGDRTILSLFKVLHRRCVRLIDNRETRRRLNPLLRKFVCNLVMYFKGSGELDDFTLTNIIAALSLADSYSHGPHGRMEFSSLIRRPNPTQPDSDEYFVIGREGKIDDPSCPMRQLQENPEIISTVPREQLMVFFGFYYARRMDPSKNAPRIHVDDFKNLVPVEIRLDPVLEDAFTEVCLSDGAWELYQRKIAA